MSATHLVDSELERRRKFIFYKMANGKMVNGSLIL